MPIIQTGKIPTTTPKLRLSCAIKNLPGVSIMTPQSVTQVGNLIKPVKKAEQAALAIEARGLVKVFGNNRAVDGIDLVVPTGCIYGLLGPNGAGKTTVINMLATLLKADAGTAKIFGHDVQHEAQIVRQLIGVTGQYATVDEKLSATENLVIFGRLLGLSGSEARKKAAELLEEFGLADAAKRTLEKFSGRHAAQTRHGGQPYCATAAHLSG